VAVCFIGGGNRRKPPICLKSLTNIITYYCIEYTSPERDNTMYMTRSRYSLYNIKNYSYVSTLLDWLIDTSAHCLTDWLIRQHTVWLIDWYVSTLFDRLIVTSAHCLTDWLIRQHTVWRIDWYVSTLFELFIRQHTVWQIDWYFSTLFDGLIDTSAHCLTDWLIVI
jgi:hypothetical protein